MKKIEGTEIRHAAALEAVQSEIIAHTSTISVTYESEDGEQPATMQDLMLAVTTARTEELERFLKQKRVKRLFFEDGYIAVRY